MQMRGSKNTNHSRKLLWCKIMKIDEVILSPFNQSKVHSDKLLLQNTKHNSANIFSDHHNMPKQRYSNNDQQIAIARQLANECDSVDALRSAVQSFSGCGLKEDAINTVFADGNRQATIVAIGEAPGAQEDKLGIPFCGESGKLLDKMFASIGLTRRDNIYITNTVFWRPPNNRRPTLQELELCKPFVEKHIALINPKLLILVGATALEALLQSEIKITSARQKFFMYNNQYLTAPISATPIFHPAYLLRQPDQKKLAWDDLQKIRIWLTEHHIMI